MLDQFFLYHPRPLADKRWASMSQLPLEDVWFHAADGTRLFGWFLQSSSQAPLFLWCHGNAGNISDRLSDLIRFFRLGFSVFLFDYRGYGKSDGYPSEGGLYKDVLGAYAYITMVRRYPASKVVVFGRSLGAAVAGYLGGQRSLAGVVLESSFPSVEEMARTHYFGLPAHWLIQANFNLLLWVKEIRRPILVIHGDRDRVVPLRLGEQVYRQANRPKYFYKVPGGGHNDMATVGGPKYFNQINNFVMSVTG